MSNKQSGSKPGSDGPKEPDFGKQSSIAQGLQSVMAVIGESYDPTAGSDVEQLVSPPPPSRLTDKIDAARSRQGSGSSVSSGLQSIMAVIGESYDSEPAKAPTPAPIVPPAPRMATPAAAAQLPPLPLPAASLAPETPLDEETRDVLSGLMPLLTEEEKHIGHLHLRAADSELSSLPPAVTRAVAPAASGSGIDTLLSQLKSDISKLEHDNFTQRTQYNLPSVIDSASIEVKSLLAQLQGDITALRNENEAIKSHFNVPQPTPVGGDVSSLLIQLQGDIAKLRRENEGLKSQYGLAAGGGSEIAGLLAQLQGDIAHMRHDEQALKNIYGAPAQQRGASLGQAFLMSLGMLTLLGAATFGGFYFANRMNSQNTENLLALVGLQQQTKETTPAAASPDKAAPGVNVAAGKTDTQVAALPAQPAAPLPSVTVKQPKLETAEVQALLTDAQNLIDLGDLVSARQMLEYAMSQDSPEAAFRLAQTFDPLYLSKIASVLSVAPDLTRAKVLYYAAARQGHQAAQKRLAELR